MSHLQKGIEKKIGENRTRLRIEMRKHGVQEKKH
jgi:hypothetical protein